MWRNHTNTGNYPTDEKCVKLAKLADLDPYVVWLAVQSEKVKSPEIKQALKNQITPSSSSPLAVTRAQ